MRLDQRKGNKTLIMETLNQTLPPKWIQTGKQTRIVTVHVWILYSAASGNQKKIGINPSLNQVRPSFRCI